MFREIIWRFRSWHPIRGQLAKFEHDLVWGPWVIYVGVYGVFYQEWVGEMYFPEREGWFSSSQILCLYPLFIQILYLHQQHLLLSLNASLIITRFRHIFWTSPYFPLILIAHSLLSVLFLPFFCLPLPPPINLARPYRPYVWGLHQISSGNSLSGVPFNDCAGRIPDYIIWTFLYWGVFFFFYTEAFKRTHLCVCSHPHHFLGRLFCSGQWRASPSRGP